MQSKTVGLVLHLSSREYNGRRIVDEARKEMVKFVRSMDDEDGFYLYHPQLLEAFFNRGEKTSALGNYETDGFKFDLSFALKQTLYVTARGFDPDMLKVVVLVTDSFVASDLPSIKKVVVLNEKESLDCKVLVIGIGDKYDIPTLSSYAEKTPSLAYVHTTPDGIERSFQEWLKQFSEEA